MKKDVAKKWVKALRSGKYKQGETYLKQLNDNGQAKHCCLGVLCELYNDEMKKNHKKMLSNKIRTKTSGADCIIFNNKEGELPKVVMKWADIIDPIGRFAVENPDYGADMYCLADLNDSGKKFTTIANIIEKNVENI
jgi:hypothetical protein